MDLADELVDAAQAGLDLGAQQVEVGAGAAHVAGDRLGLGQQGVDARDAGPRVGEQAAQLDDTGLGLGEQAGVAKHALVGARDDGVEAREQGVAAREQGVAALQGRLDARGHPLRLRVVAEHRAERTARAV